MWTHTLNPTLLDLGQLEIRWYGLVYVLGFFLAVYWLRFLAKKQLLNLSKDDIWDFVFYLMLGVLIGSRLFMVFWNPSYYLPQPWNLLKIWEGGMSFHGGFVGIVIAAWLFCKKQKLDFWRLADAVSVPAIFALAFGRLANFINGELWGRPWDGSWCVNFKNTGGGDMCRHPNMIYSFFQRMLVFGWLFLLTFWKSFTPGFVFWNFVFWEGLGRILVDFFREDPLYFGFTLGQWFSAMMVVVALWMFWKRYRRDWEKLFSWKKKTKTEYL